MKKEDIKKTNDDIAAITPTNTEISKLSEHLHGDLTVEGQLQVGGDITVNGKIRSTSEGGIGTVNPENNDTSAYLGFSNNTARIRLRGDGLGADGPFQIQGRGDSVRLSVEEDGTVINGTLDVSKKITAPEFIGDLAGNATTASTLKTPHTINGIPFDGSESITITANPSTHSHPISQVTNLQTELNNRSPLTHTHTWNQITGQPSTFPPATHSHNWDSITGRPATFAPVTHNHTWNQISDRPTIPTASTTNPVAPGTVAVGTGTTFARADHRHPLPTSAQIGALPTIGGTISGNLTVSGNIDRGNTRIQSNWIGTHNNNSFHIRRNNVNIIDLNSTSTTVRGGNGYLTVNNTSVRSMTIFNRTTSNAGNVRVESAGTLARSTSASKYKLMIKKIDTDALAERILDIEPKSWFDKPATEQYADYLTKKYNGENIDPETEYMTPLKRHHGLIAEDVVAAGLDMYVDRDHNGEIEGIEYDRLWTLLIPLVRDQRNTITKLNEEIHSLQQRIEKLETKEGE